MRVAWCLFLLAQCPGPICGQWGNSRPPAQPPVYVDTARLIELLVLDPRFRGPAGPPGPAGPMPAIDTGKLVEVLLADGRFRGSSSLVDYQRLRDELAKDERFRGPPGSAGAAGSDGSAGATDRDALWTLGLTVGGLVGLPTWAIALLGLLLRRGARRVTGSSPAASHRVDVVTTPPVVTTRTENDYVRVESNVEAEAYREAIRREAKVSPQIAPYLERIEATAGSILGRPMPAKSAWKTD